jgi:hypothetical protein
MKRFALLRASTVDDEFASFVIVEAISRGSAKATFKDPVVIINAEDCLRIAGLLQDDQIEASCTIRTRSLAQNIKEEDLDK